MYTSVNGLCMKEETIDTDAVGLYLTLNSLTAVLLDLWSANETWIF